eukprot:gnl/Chilomastix_caulleri/4547.p1 GENE.gnl/Chilomastix_caulleri/4547~~gnl/Chilomastix_caulleri/4547.p1  ORF type:complete len:106 (+),score=9.89 gnl/Chilomastix_caulleri/4547:31-348(+)
MTGIDSSEELLLLIEIGEYYLKAGIYRYGEFQLIKLDPLFGASDVKENSSFLQSNVFVKDVPKLKGSSFSDTSEYCVVGTKLITSCFSFDGDRDINENNKNQIQN